MVRNIGKLQNVHNIAKNIEGSSSILPVVSKLLRKNGPEKTPVENDACAFLYWAVTNVQPIVRDVNIPDDIISFLKNTNS